jgi:hypothetical protein
VCRKESLAVRDPFSDEAEKMNQRNRKNKTTDSRTFLEKLD